MQAIQYAVTPDQWTKLQAVAKSKGLTLTGNSGTTEYDGITFSYSYDGTKSVSISIVKKPFFVSELAIENHLNQLYQEMYNS